MTLALLKARAGFCTGVAAQRSPNPSIGDTWTETDTAKYYVCIATGVWTDITAGGGGAPVGASYITTDPEAGLTNEKVLGTDIFMAGLVVARPIASKQGRHYWATDEHILYRDSGIGWDKVGTLDLADMTDRDFGSLSGGLSDAQHGARAAGLHADSHAAITLGGGSDAALALAGQQLTLADVLTPAEHTAIGDAAPHHASVTLGGGSDPALALAGQQLTLANVMTPAEHTAIGDGAPHHAPITLGGGSDPALALAGQQLTLADVLTPAEHTAIGNNAPHHAPVTIGADLEHSLAGQVLSGTDAAAGQKGHIQLTGQLGGAAASPDVRGVREPAGPTLLAIAAIADGQYLRRVGAQVVGSPGTVVGAGSRYSVVLVAASNASAAFTAVADYVCDGINDDVEIRTAVDALPVLGGDQDGGIVLLSDGCFYLGAAGLDLSSCVRKHWYQIKGQGGPYATVLYGPDGVPIITLGTGALYSQDYVEIDDLCLESTGTSVGTIGLLVQGARNIRIRNVKVQQGHVGMRFTKAEWITLDNVWIQGCRQYCLDIVIDSYADGHFHANDCTFWLPSTAINDASSVHLVGGPTLPNPWYEALFTRCQLYVSPSATGTNVRCFHQEGTMGTVYQATRNLTFEECHFEDEGDSVDDIGADFETTNHINFIGCTFASGGAMKFGIRTAGQSYTGAGVTTDNTHLNDARRNWPTGGLVGVIITCNGKTATVTANTATQLTFAGGWSGGGNPGNGFAYSATAYPGCYTLLNCYFNINAPAGGYHIYNNVGDFYLLGYTWDNLTNHFLTPGTVHQIGFSLTKAGAVSDADFGDGILPMSGMMGVDTTNHRLYVRDNATWRWTALT